MLLFCQITGLITVCLAVSVLNTVRVSATTINLFDECVRKDHLLSASVAVVKDDISPFTHNSEGGPLRYIDRYGIPGEGPVPGVTIGTPGAPYPVGGTSAGTPEGVASSTPTPTAAPATVTLPSSASQTASKEAAKKKATKQGKQKKRKPSTATAKPIVPPVVVNVPEPQYDPIREALFNLATKQYDKAIALANNVLVLNPNHPYAHYVKAVASVMLHRYHEASLEYKEVLRLVPNTQLGNRARDGLKKLE